MKMKSLISAPAAAFALAATFMFSPVSPAQAQSICKGLSKSACSANDACSHVAAFTRSDGANVKAFCRAKPGGGAKKTTKKKTSSKKKTASTKDSDAKVENASVSKEADDTKSTSKSKTTSTKKKTTKRKDNL